MKTIFYYFKLTLVFGALAVVSACEQTKAYSDDTISIVDSRADSKKVVVIFHLGTCDYQVEVEKSDMNNERKMARHLDQAIRHAEGPGRCYKNR
jgi:hypothetical protein